MNQTSPSVETILAEAVVIASSADRQAFVEKACAGDAALRSRVDRLIANHFRSGSFLEHPAAVLATVAPPDQIEAIGSWIGPYKLMEEIGEGGMGLVFVAEQQNPVRRKVALKVIKPGMDTREVISRFEAERQALALMDHPNIAKVLDAGTTGVVEERVSGWGLEVSEDRGHASVPAPNPQPLAPISSSALTTNHYPLTTTLGRPYFVMELVKGVPITEHCDQHQLGTRERLELFLQVCQAVQHAHQKGIIHRDLKPSNVLVTMHDATPLVKVIDFGVAKAIGQQLTEKTLYTGIAQMLGTPLYMSPEQAGQSSLDVDTRSDVYSLGVLLYELLTGTTPFDGETLRKAGFDEMRRIIREDEPPRPSQRVSTLHAGSLSTISGQRNIDPRKLSHQLRGELDWIVMKCLEKDRTRRYETASAFAADVERYLKDEPVQACPPSTAYRFRKFARRNRAILTTAALVGAALVVGTVVSASQAVRAMQAESQAKGNERQARANLKKAREAVDQMLLRVAGRLANVPHMEQVRRELLGDSLKFYEGFLQEHSTDPDVRFETGLAYLEFGKMQKMLGEDRPAEQAYAQAIRIFQKLVDKAPDKADYRFNLAQSHNELGHVLRGTGRFSEAEQSFRQALAITRKLDADFPNKYRGWVAGRLNNIGVILHSTGRLAEAESVHREALAIRTEYYPNDSRPLFESYSNLGVVLRQAARFAEAEQFHRQALEVQKKVAAASPDSQHEQSRLAIAHRNLAITLWETGRLTEVESCFRNELPISEKLAADFPNTLNYRESLADGHHDFGEVLLETDQLPEAESAYRRAQDIYENLANEFPGNPGHRWKVDENIRSLGLALLDTGQRSEVEKLVEQSLVSSEKLVAEFPNVSRYRKSLGWAHGYLGMVRYRAADWNAAVTSLKKCFELAADDPEATDCQFFLAMAHWQLGDKDQAQKSYDQAVQWMDKHKPHDQRLRRFRTEAADLLKVKSGDTDRR